MGEAMRGKPSEIEHFSLPMTGYPIDLLKRFTSVSNRAIEIASATEDTEEIELNLGLSLGGCFGVDPKEKRQLVRTSSVAGLTFLAREDDAVTPQPVAPLPRTCSLPTETEDERRKRKELQCLRRMEAKRKRSEKQRNFRAGRDRASLEGSVEEEKRIEDDTALKAMNFKGKVEGASATALAKEQQQFRVANRLSATVGQQFGVPSWAASPRGAALPHGFDATANEKGSILASAAAALRGYPGPTSQGSIGSQGSSSSGISEFESRQVQGFSSCTEARSPASVQSLSEQVEQKTVISPKATTEMAGKSVGGEMDTSEKSKMVRNGFNTLEMGRNVMEEMPCVSTTGDGPNGKRIEGFLYKYRKGEEVRIVCVCHGSFLSPAEFIKHAGGSDVAHPLKHIVVNPSPSFL
ncbi:ninja-family protein AFP3-like [Macadamia integrifolia]|uniref:ninja-family protein AFP3-like n=1 Tax=Macadamia integrifolia TaxID=60698 RepID=UPI001C4EA4F0|nr:ninja-family protein AFP3-like [Macadamia integrifolia]